MRLENGKVRIWICEGKSESGDEEIVVLEEEPTEQGMKDMCFTLWGGSPDSWKIEVGDDEPGLLYTKNKNGSGSFWIEPCAYYEFFVMDVG